MLAMEPVGSRKTPEERMAEAQERIAEAEERKVAALKDINGILHWISFGLALLALGVLFK